MCFLPVEKSLRGGRPVGMLSLLSSIPRHIEASADVPASKGGLTLVGEGRLMLLLKCIAQALAKQGARALASLVPMGEVAYDIAVDTWERYTRAKKQEGTPELSARLAAVTEMQALANEPSTLTPAIRDAAREASPTSQFDERIASYLTYIPALARQRLRWFNDPTGRTAPPYMRVNGARDLLPLIPMALPRFRTGQLLPQIDHWQLVELVSLTSFKEVWRARHSQGPVGSTSILVFCTDPRGQKHLQHVKRQVIGRAAAAVNRPGIVPLRFAYLDYVLPFLVYDDVGSYDLAAMIRDWKGTSQSPGTDQIISIVRQLAEALSGLHRLQPPFVHGGLSPADVIVVKREKHQISFHIANCWTGDLEMDHATRQARLHAARGERLANVLRGAASPLYASPEQRRGCTPTTREDVYALGVIGSQLLTGDLAAEAVESTTGGGPGLPSISPTLLHILNRCIDPNPRARPENAGILAEQLRSLAVANPSPDPPAPPNPLVARPKVALQEEIVSSIGIRLRLIRPGTFLMGAPKSEARSDEDERPQHLVEITRPFYIGFFPVTVAQFLSFIRRTSYKPRTSLAGTRTFRLTDSQWVLDPSCNWRNPGFVQGEDHPVVCMSWGDAVAFCAWLSSKDGRRFRLPTEAEWEYACRAGTCTPFYFGETLGARHANFDARYPYGEMANGSCSERTTRVGSYPPNPWGLFDMHGNVYEWCFDMYGGDYYSYSPRTDPEGPPGGKARVLRGGSWFSRGLGCRAAARLFWLAPEAQIYPYFGFRVVCSAG